MRANVAFYPVDARGLVALPARRRRVAGLLARHRNLQRKQAGGHSASFNDTQETLVTIAADTGGKAMLDTNDLTMGIRQAQEDIEQLLHPRLLQPRTPPMDGKYRRIDVRLVERSQRQARFPQRILRHRRPGRNSTPRDKERQLEEALTLGDPVNELPLALEVDYFRVATRSLFRADFREDPRLAPSGFQKKGAKQTADFDFIGQVRDASGKLDQRRARQHHREAGRSQRGETRPAVPAIRRRVDARAGHLHAAIPGARKSKRQNGHVRNQVHHPGSERRQIAAPQLRDLEQSEGSGEPRRSARPEPTRNCWTPARWCRTIRRSSPASPACSARIRPCTSISRSTIRPWTPIASSPACPRKWTCSWAPQSLHVAAGAVAKLGTMRPGVAPFAFQIPLAKLPPGQYISQVNVIDETGRKFAFPRNEIVLLARTIPHPPPRK